MRIRRCDRCRTYGGNPYCDAHQVPPVCICDQPDPDTDGECRTCRRLFADEREAYWDCRDAWRAHLGIRDLEVAHG